MTGAARELPSSPSLRHLKLEAKRRLSAGEFSALYEAQLVIAREHGHPSWTALKKVIDQSHQQSHVVPHLRWVVSRFRDAGRPGWVPPRVSELRRHFDEEFLRRIPPGELIAVITEMAADLREGFAVTAQAPLAAQVRMAGTQIIAVAEADLPHRVTRVGRFPLGSRIADARVAAPAARTSGMVPEVAGEIAAEAVAELGLPGIVLAGGGPDIPAWTAVLGWADLDRAEPLTADHRFPACTITRLITATAILRLVAGGRVGLDDPADEHLRASGLADDAVTVRELLTHTSGLDDPVRTPLAGDVPGLARPAGPVLPRRGTRGVFRFSDAGYAVLGQLVADVTRMSYPDAAACLVLRPLGMRDSSFQGSWPGSDSPAVTGYRLSPEMTFAPVPAVVSATLASRGMWTTAADLLRFGATWSSLLPEALAREALRPQAARGRGGVRMGLGWPMGADGDIIGISGGGPGTFASLLVRMGSPHRSCVAHVAMTNRRLPIQAINVRVLRASAGRAPTLPAGQAKLYAFPERVGRRRLRSGRVRARDGGGRLWTHR